MVSSCGQQILLVYDVNDDTREYLAELIDDDIVLHEDLRQTVNESLLAGAEAWQAAVECANSLRNQLANGFVGLKPHDTLSYIPIATQTLPKDDSRVATNWPIALAQDQKATAGIKDVEVDNQNHSIETPECYGPWAKTDGFIAQARAQALAAQAFTESLWPDSQADASTTRRDLNTRKPKKRKREKVRNTSQYWTCYDSHDEGLSQHNTLIEAQNIPGEDVPEFTNLTTPRRRLRESLCHETPRSSPRLRSQRAVSHVAQIVTRELGKIRAPTLTDVDHHRDAKQSPYFGLGTPTKRTAKKRSLPGTVASVPFPSLNDPRFGLAQERYAHEPYWLLMAVTFLIKTRGTVAMPVFRQLKERFPSAHAILDPVNERAIKALIQPLGLVNNRFAMMHKYSRLFIEKPPKAGVRYSVRGYDPREVALEGSDTYDTAAAPIEAVVNRCDWEIGHMTQGKYALDSWRIFCRDELLGRATDWNGKDAKKSELQPEWMRVRPDDKELRAYLRWMWMREGWEWDPRTGERVVLCDELRQAVNELRVGYDDCGDLKITDERRAA